MVSITMLVESKIKSIIQISDKIKNLINFKLTELIRHPILIEFKFIFCCTSKILMYVHTFMYIICN